MRVSLKPSTFVEFAGIDDVDVTIGDAMFCYFNYDGSSPEFAMNRKDESFKLVLAVQFNEDGKEPGRPQAYSAGDAEFFQPNETGAYLVATGTKQALNSSTNASLFLASLCNAGFPEASLDTEAGVKSAIGCKVHVNQMGQPKRSGNLVRTPAPGQKPFDPDKQKTILLVTRILAMPGQTVVATATLPKTATLPFAQAAATPATTTKPAVASIPIASASPSNGSASAEVRELAVSTLINLLAENGGKLTKKELPAKAFAALKGNALSKQVVPLVFDDKFLSTTDGIRFNGSEVEMA